MKIIKYIFGTLASIYVILQVVNVLRFLMSDRADFSKPYAGSFVLGGVAGIVIGLAIAIFCFRRSK